ncbi:metallophosphoesterase [Methylobacterium oryzae CBMB20]
MTRHADPRAAGLGAVRAPAPARAATAPRRYRLWVMSDLAVDRTATGLPPFALPDPLPDFDVLAVAGDVADDLERSVERLARSLDGRQGSRPVVLVPGNREFWNGRTVEETLARGRDMAGRAGIALLSDDALRIDDGRGTGLCLLGATLWTDWALHGARRATLARGHARHNARDCRRIRRAGTIPYLPHDAGGAHARSRAFIEDALGSIVVQATGFRASPVALVRDARPGDRAVVVSHHAPTVRSLPTEVLPDLCDEWIGASLASDLEGLMDGWGAPALWIHGHVPGAVDVTVGRTRIVANPRVSGWACGRAPFDPTFIVEA